MANVRKIVYKTARAVSRSTHHYLRQVEHAVLRGQAVARVALKLRAEGFTPDIMIGHNAWGEILYLKGKLNELMSQHTGKPVEVIERDTDRDRYMSAQEALDYGIIDNIVTSRSELAVETKPAVVAAG